jgi:hypothetical protein
MCVRADLSITVCLFLYLMLGDSIALAQVTPRVRDGDGTKAAELPASVDALLRYLPLRTQTIMVCNRPFKIEKSDLEPDPMSTERQLRAMILGLDPEILNAGLGRALLGRNVTAAVQGSTDFREPKGLGRAPYAGTSIIQLNEEFDLAQGNLTNVHPSIGSGQWGWIAGHRTLIFKITSFEDSWSYFVTNMNANTIVWSTDRRHLEETLQRMSGLPKDRPLPPTLVEWRFLDTERPFWGIRHYERNGAAADPTSPLAGASLGANTLDGGAIGCSFSYDDSDRKFRITYLSKSVDAASVARKMFGVTRTSGSLSQHLVDALHVVSVVADPRNSENDLKTGLAPTIFFVLAALGHALFM